MVTNWSLANKCRGKNKVNNEQPIRCVCVCVWILLRDCGEKWKRTHTISSVARAFLILFLTSYSPTSIESYTYHVIEERENQCALLCCCIQNLALFTHCIMIRHWREERKNTLRICCTLPLLLPFSDLIWSVTCTKIRVRPLSCILSLVLLS